VSSLQELRFSPDPVIRAATNRHQFGLIVSMDVWIMNIDRGAHNVYITLDHGRPTLRLIDHGHVLLLPRNEKGAEPDPDDWEAFVQSGAFEDSGWTERLPSGHYLRPFVSEEEIVAAAGKITSLGDGLIREAVEAVDEQFFFATREAVVTLLVRRRERLEACLEAVL
jgi:hypothetical protein